MPGYSVVKQDGGKIRDEWTCSYCKLVLKDPVQSSETGLRLCKECFDKAQRYVSLVVLVFTVHITNCTCMCASYDQHSDLINMLIVSSLALLFTRVKSTV